MFCNQPKVVAYKHSIKKPTDSPTSYCFSRMVINYSFQIHQQLSEKKKLDIQNMRFHNGRQWREAKLIVEEAERQEKLEMMRADFEALQEQAPVGPSSSNK